MKKIITSRKRTVMLILLSFLVLSISAQTKVVIPGTFQSELGCVESPYNYYGDWDPNCDYTSLTYDLNTGLWTGAFNIPAGCHQYKVAIDGSWSLNYGEFGIPGGANIQLSVSEQTMVTFSYNPITHLVETTPTSSGFSISCIPQVILTGSLQYALGCGNNWDPSCTNSSMTYNSESGKFEGDFIIPAGCYEYRVIHNGEWINSFGILGLNNDNNYVLNVPITSSVHFSYDPYTHITTSANHVSYCPPYFSVAVTGTFQDEIGCDSDWQTCSSTILTFNAETGLYEGNFNIPTGCYQYRIALNDNWAYTLGRYGSYYDSDYLLSVPESTTNVHFTFNPNYNIASTPFDIYGNNCPPKTVSLVGTFQNELGCNADWSSDCNNTSLVYNSLSDTFEAEVNIPAGCYEYRVVLNGDFVNTLGRYGTTYDANYLISIPQNTNSIRFIFYPSSNTVYSIYNQYGYTCPPSAVAIAGSFGDELGCAYDWQPDCAATQMQYNSNYGAWIDTLNLTTGHWEYKITINNSWDENYGQFGIRNGENIPLDLCYDATVVFIYYHYEWYHYVYTQIITNGICAYSFYDSNVNGYRDIGEPSMPGVPITINGNNIVQTQLANNEGKASFAGMPDGLYQVTSQIPVGYLSTSYDSSQFAYLYNSSAELHFGNVCLGPGGAKSIGYWTNKNGETQLISSERLPDLLNNLRYFSLRNADGSDFDPYNYMQLKTWLQKSNSKNMMYMLSAQLTSLYLNLEMANINYGSMLYAPGIGYMGGGKFIDPNSLLWYTNYYLQYQTIMAGNEPNRDYTVLLLESLSGANNNTGFAQDQPCSDLLPSSNARISKEGEMFTAVIYPNPSNNFFIIKVGDTQVEELSIKALDVNGRTVYFIKESGRSEYIFGHELPAGVYFVQIDNGTNRSTIKVIKQ